MPRDRDGPLRITMHRSCDTALSRAVIRTIVVTVLNAPDLGCQENGTRSPRPVSADKSRGSARNRESNSPAESLGTARWTDSLHASPRYSSRNDRRGRR